MTYNYLNQMKLSTGTTKIVLKLNNQKKKIKNHQKILKLEII